MPRPIPPLHGITLTFLRLTRGWAQKDLAATTKTAKNKISDFECGAAKLTRDKLESLAAAMGVDRETVAIVVSYLELALAGPTAASSDDSWFEPSAAERRGIERIVAQVVRAAGGVARAELARALERQRACQARAEAEGLRARLKRFSPRDRLVLVEGAPEYQTWTLCERLCEESVKAAVKDPGQARGLAELAFRVAEMVPGSDAWRALLQAYAWAHIGNASRVANDLPAADAAFVRSRALWQAGASIAPGPLDQGRLLDLEASLRCAQRRFTEALQLHEQALGLTTGKHAAAFLLNKAVTLEQAGDYERAIATLREAAPLLDRVRQPRLLLVALFNLAVDLGHTGRHQEAADVLPEIRALAVRLDNDLDLLRLRWLEARVASVLGRRKEALAGLVQVRRGFAARGMIYDAALATLELAALLAEQGETREVKRLAHEMAATFDSLGVHREALASLHLFREAAEQEALTAEHARRLAADFERARRAGHLRATEGG